MGFQETQFLAVGTFYYNQEMQFLWPVLAYQKYCLGKKLFKSVFSFFFRYPQKVMDKILSMAEGIKVTDAPVHTTRDELVAKVKKRGISSSNG